MRWTSAFRPLFRAGENVLDRLLCVAGAVAFSQLPEFIQQYLQRLGGHLDEARRHLEHFTRLATEAGLSLADYITRTAGNPDEAVARLSGVMSEAVSRVEHLEAADAAIRGASLWSKPFVFLAHLDADIASAAWRDYKPAVPTTLEGLIYAGLGIVVILGLYYGAIHYPLAAALRRRKDGKSAATGAVSRGGVETTGAKSRAEPGR